MENEVLGSVVRQKNKGRALYYARLRRSYLDVRPRGGFLRRPRVLIRSVSSMIDIARPRDVAEVRVTPRFIELHNAIWADLREEVLKGYENQRNRVK